MKKIACVCFMIVILASLGTVCVSAEDQNIISPENFGQGVYYFSLVHTTTFRKDIPYRDPKIFGRSLAAFKAEHPGFKVTSMAPQISGGASSKVNIEGYWVNFEKK